MSIDGYATEFLRRVATKGGEVGAYIKENVAHRRRFDIEKNSTGSGALMARAVREKQTQ